MNSLKGRFQRIAALVAVVVLAGALVTAAPTFASSTTNAQNNATGTAQDQSGNLTAATVIRNLRQSHQQMDGYNSTSETRIVITNRTGDETTHNTTHMTGELSVKFPNKMRSVIHRPGAHADYTYVFNNNIWTIYDATNNTVFTYEVAGANAATAKNIRYTLAHSQVSYNGTATVGGESTYVLSVRPTVNDAPDHIQYYLDQETYLPVKSMSETTARFEDTTLTTRTVSTMTNEVDPSTPNSVFTLDPPENATCVHTNRPKPNSSVCDTVNS